MNDITKLPDKWRQKRRSELDATNFDLYELADCADELEQALPKWTRITEEPDTWPEDETTVFLSYIANGKRSFEMWGFKDSDNLMLMGDYWRPLCDLDYPPIGEDDD